MKKPILITLLLSFTALFSAQKVIKNPYHKVSKSGIHHNL